jgi:hypothetical protein
MLIQDFSGCNLIFNFKILKEVEKTFACIESFKYT